MAAQAAMLASVHAAAAQHAVVVAWRKCLRRGVLRLLRLMRSLTGIAEAAPFRAQRVQVPACRHCRCLIKATDRSWYCKCTCVGLCSSMVMVNIGTEAAEQYKMHSAVAATHLSRSSDPFLACSLGAGAGRLGGPSCSPAPTAVPLSWLSGACRVASTCHNSTAW